LTLSFSRASTAAATAKYVLPVPAGPTPNTNSLEYIFFMYSCWFFPLALIFFLGVLISTLEKASN